MKSYHIIFNSEYLDKMQIDKEHPTCSIKNQNDTEYLFGGSLNDESDKNLNHLITLSPIPSEIEIYNVSKLTLAIDFELFFNSLLCDKYLYYQHDVEGYPTLFTKDITVSNEYDKKPIIETKVKLGETPLEWSNQEWEDGNNNKIGGVPTWVQEPEYLNCPCCKEKMMFLMHLNSDLPVNEPVQLHDELIYKDTIMFGNGGICYVYWCDKDRISGYLWQST
ncbi:hypothetical protein [Aquimarina sp. I32.4]|uniref:hypothetical protein n=1 Tax=Aquimarina sp. I32.4 TaxID=2053903 RepID=UPI0011AF8CC2|nr:hypothetical protein [Aquimarina sp. I32.4]